MAQYEQRERDRLLLYDNTMPRTVRQLFRPTRGVIVRSAQPDRHEYGVAIRTAKNESVLATMRGTIVSVARMEDNSFTMTLQNGSFVTIYRQLSQAIKTQGTSVERGEAIGMTDGEKEIIVELWDAGQFVNPEEVIVW